MLLLLYDCCLANSITSSNHIFLWQHRTIPALRLKHRSGSCGTASALPKCSIMSGCGTRIVLRGHPPLALCDRCPCFGSLFPPLAALTFAASSIICAFGLAAAAPRSLYRHLELCGIALGTNKMNYNSGRSSASFSCQSISGVLGTGSGKNSSGLKTSRMAQGGVSGGGVPVSKNRKAVS